MTLVKDLMTRSVHACHPNDSLEIACRIMWENDCGSVPVVDDGLRVRGMITDRDVCMAAWNQGRPLKEIPVGTACSSDLVCCLQDDPVSEAERLMMRHRVRRLPVTDPYGRLLGVLSLSDIIGALSLVMKPLAAAGAGAGS
jgi:CBS domain-containing protein